MAYRTSDIDASFPVAGVDNESQGFRDNFSAIVDSLTQAETDITALETTSLNKTDEISDLSGNQILDAELCGVTAKSYSSASLVANQNIGFLNGHYQVFPINADVVLNLADWPDAGRAATIRVHLVGTSSTERTIDFTVDGGGDIYYDDTWLAMAGAPTITVDDGTTAHLVEFWSYDGGSNVYAKYLGTFTQA